MRFGHHFYKWDRAWEDDLDLRLRLTKEAGWEGFEDKFHRIGVPPESVREKCGALGISCVAIGVGIKEAVDNGYAAGAGIVGSGVRKEECA